MGVPDWPPKTCPRPFSSVAPRRDECPLSRGNSNPPYLPYPIFYLLPRPGRGPSRRPDDSDAGGRGQVEGGRKVATGEFKRFFPHSTSRFPQQKREALLADRVREVGGWPEFSVRYGRAIAPKSCCFIGK